MEIFKILTIAFCLVSSFMISGCIQQPEFNFKEQCVVYDNFCLNGSCEGFVTSISKDIKCTGHMRENGTLTLNFVDNGSPKQADRIYTTIDTGGSSMDICYLNDSEFEKVKGMPIESLLSNCINQNFHLSCYILDPSSENAVLQCGDGSAQQIVSRDSKGNNKIYYFPFWVGKQIDLIDPLTGEMNLTAYQKVQNDKSCQELDYEFHSYACGTPGVFVAIPQ